MKKKIKPQKPKRQPSIKETYLCEAEVAEGLEDVGRRELTTHLQKRILLHKTPRRAAPGVIRFTYTGGLRALMRMRTVQTLYFVRHFDVPRPRALLGDENFRALLEDIERIREVHPSNAFKTFVISAAGGGSSVLKRLKADIAKSTGLKEGFEEGDLLMRLRRTPGKAAGWDVLFRISPRPLATRDWRVCNMEGALNATVAHAMGLMTDPRAHDVYLNIGCGSGTLLIERLAYAPAKQAIGCDLSLEALDCAAQNVAAAGLTDKVELKAWDARNLPLPDASVDALSADFPFGHLVGSHDQNIRLYPALLNEAARVAKPGALFTLITHEIRLMETLLEETSAWRTVEVLRVALGGLYPRIFVIQRI